MIYFILDAASCAIKIGFSDDPRNRLRILQTGNPNPLRLLGVMPGGEQEEARLHEKFARYRIGNSEWFLDCPGLRCAIQPLCLRLLGRPISSVYLAGRMDARGWHWRRSISVVDGEPFERIISPPFGDVFSVARDDDAWPVKKEIIVVADGPAIDYCGPYWVDQRGDLSGQVGLHGAGMIISDLPPEDLPPGQSHHLVRSRPGFIAGNCLAAIDRADLLFAWVDGPDAHGTLVEIGYAAARRNARVGPLVVVATPPELYREIWFALQMADISIAASYPEIAWSRLWAGRWVVQTDVIQVLQEFKPDSVDPNPLGPYPFTAIPDHPLRNDAPLEPTPPPMPSLNPPDPEEAPTP